LFEQYNVNNSDDGVGTMYLCVNCLNEKRLYIIRIR